MHFISSGSINTKYCPEGNFPYKVISIARKMWLLTFLLSPSLLQALSWKHCLVCQSLKVKTIGMFIFPFPKNH